MIVTYDARARTFTMQGQFLISTYPIEDFPKWLEFYRGMKADYPKAKGAYDATVAALEAFAKEMAATLG
ncbi:hypothetical protein [Falsirhodobacter sp. 1013]|uniref:hypothetical protein n=1 Tax=Falsirhodobacter sp. 1013 TaxID=3417566 RepID=UPI003EBC9CDF